MFWNTVDPVLFLLILKGSSRNAAFIPAFAVGYCWAFCPNFDPSAPFWGPLAYKNQSNTVLIYQKNLQFCRYPNCWSYCSSHGSNCFVFSVYWIQKLKKIGLLGISKNIGVCFLGVSDLVHHFVINCHWKYMGVYFFHFLFESTIFSQIAINLQFITNLSFMIFCWPLKEASSINPYVTHSPTHTPWQIHQIFLTYVWQKD